MFRATVIVDGKHLRHVTDGGDLVDTLDRDGAATFLHREDAEEVARRAIGQTETPVRGRNYSATRA